jgi:hypothetical protein
VRDLAGSREHSRPGVIRLGPRFLSTPYTTLCEAAGEPALFAKVASRVRPKRYLRCITVPNSTTLYKTAKFGIADIIRYEDEVFGRLPAELEPFLPRRRHLTLTDDGRPALCAERPFDVDGRPARTVLETGPIDNGPFWNDVDRIVRVLRERATVQLSAFTPRTCSLLVHRVSRTQWRAEITNVLKFGRRLNWYRPWKMIPPVAWHKFECDLARFRAAYDRRSST